MKIFWSPVIVMMMMLMPALRPGLGGLWYISNTTYMVSVHGRGG